MHICTKELNFHTDIIITYEFVAKRINSNIKIFEDVDFYMVFSYMLVGCSLIMCDT